MLQVEKLTKMHGHQQGIQNISFQLHKKQICAVVGSNGSGKTTLFRTLLGLYQPDSGKIQILSNKPKAICFGYLPEERSVLADLKTTECITLFAQLKKMKPIDIENGIYTWMNRLKCLDLANKTMKQCSKGNQQKIQLICALIHNPDILILDEPLTGLDMDNITLFKSILFQCKQEGKAILLSSHRYEEIENLCDEVLVIKESQVVHFEKMADLRKRVSRKTITISDDPMVQYVFEKGVIDVVLDNKLTHYIFNQEQDAIKFMMKVLKERDNRSVKMTSLAISDLLKEST